MRIERDEIGAFLKEEIGEIETDESKLQLIREDDSLNLLRESFRKKVQKLGREEQEKIEKSAQQELFLDLAAGMDPEEVEMIASDICDIDEINEIWSQLSDEALQETKDKILVSREEFEEQVTSQSSYRLYQNGEKLLTAEVINLSRKEPTPEIEERIDYLKECITAIQEEMGATRSYYREEGYDEKIWSAEDSLLEKLEETEPSLGAILYPEYYQKSISDKVEDNLLSTLIFQDSYHNASPNFKEQLKENMAKRSASKNDLDNMIEESETKKEDTARRNK